MGITNDTNKPFLIDVNVNTSNDLLQFDVTFSTMHIKDFSNEQHVNYTLYYDDMAFFNSIEGCDIEGVIQLHYTVKTKHVWNDGEVVAFSIVNNVQNRRYTNILSCAHIPPREKLPVVSCSYISNYNSIAELRSFVAFQKIRNVSRVVFYKTTTIPGFNAAFRNVIRNGFIKVVHFRWPREGKLLKLRLNHQQAQINSCFYRYKYVANAVISCDVDEYLYSDIFPFSAPEMIQELKREFPKFHTFLVC